MFFSFIHTSSCNRDDQSSPNFHRFVKYAYNYVGIHQVRILVFDKYQTCPVPLSCEISGLVFVVVVGHWIKGWGSMNRSILGGGM